MKRFWLGIVLLGVLLILGVLEAKYVQTITQPVSDILSQAVDAAQEEDWSKTGQLLQQAESRWQSQWSLLAAMNHHGPMEEIDSQFARADALLEGRAYAEFTACCARIGEMIRALGDAHTFRVENLL